MADVGSLGQYKVVVTADYSQLQTQFKAMMDLVTNTTKSMTDTLNNSTKAMSQIMSTNIKTMVDSMNSAFSGADTAIKDFGQTAENVAKTAQSASTKIKNSGDGFKNYAKQVKEAKAEMEKAFQKADELQTRYNLINNDSVHGRADLAYLKESKLADTARDLKEAKAEAERLRIQYDRLVEAQKRFKEYAGQTQTAQKEQIREAIAGANAQIKAIDEQEKRNSRTLQGQMRAAQQVQNAEHTTNVQQAQNATRQSQRISHLQTQYRVAYEEINKYMQAHAKMSEAVFIRLQGRMTAIGDEIRRMGAVPTMPNPFEGMDYDKYASGFSRIDDVLKSIRHHLMWMASAAVIGAGFGIPVAVSKSIESFDALQTKILQNMELANQYAGDTNKLHSAVDQMGEAAKVYAKGFGVSLGEVQEAMQTLTRRYKDADTAIYLTGIALKMSKLDMIDTKLAAKDLEAVLLQFGMGAKDAGKFLNDFSVICHVARTSGTDMLMALERSGSAFASTAMGAREAMAAIAAVSTVTGKTGSTIGDSWKSILANLDFKKAQAALEAYNIKLYEVGKSGEKVQRQGAVVLKDILQQYAKLDDEGQKKLATAIAGGKYQVNNMQAFLRDSSQSFLTFLKEMEEKSSDATTESLLEASMNTYQTKLAQAKASFEVLGVTIGNMVLPYLKDFAILLGAAGDYLSQHSNKILGVVGVLGRLAFAYLAVFTAMKIWGAGQAILTAIQGAMKGVVLAEAAHTAILAIKNGLFAIGVPFVLAYNAAMAETGIAASIAAGGMSLLNSMLVAFETLLAPIGVATLAVIAIIATLGVVAYEVYENWETVSNELTYIWNTLVEVISAAVEAIILAISPFIAIAYALVQVVEWAIQEIIVPAFTFLGQAVKAAIDFCAGVLSWFWNKVKEFAAWVVKGITGIIPGVAGFVGGWASIFQQAIQPLIDFATNVVRIAEKVKNAIKSMLTLGKDSGSEESEGIIAKIKSWIGVNDPESEISKMMAKVQEAMNLKGGSVDGIIGGGAPHGFEPNALSGGGSGSSGSKGKGGKGSKGAKETDNSIEAMLYRHMTKSLKLTHAQAVAELANIQQESGFNYQADNGTHKGLYQFDSNRWAEYQAWLANTGRTDSAVSQVDYRNQYESKYVPYEAQMQQAYLQSGATTPEEYAAAFNQYIERSGEVAGDVGYENRMRNARDLDKRFSKRNGEENFDDVLSARENAYKQLYEQFDREVENLKTERAKIGQGVSAEEKKKIFEKVMGVGDGKGNAIFTEVEKAQKDYTKILLECAKEEAKRTEAIKKAADTQVQAVEKMADSEIAFAEKLGLIDKSDVRAYEWDKNESTYAKQKPMLEAKLGSTVDMDKGTADDMLAAYRGYVYAKTDLDAKYYAEKMFNLSRDVNATEKALSEMYKLEQSYHEKRVKLEQEAFLEKDKYTLKFIDSMTNAIQSGLEGILTRTKSFGEAFRDIFKSVVNDIIKMFTEDLSQSIKKWLSNLLHPQKKTGNPAGVYGDIDGGLGGIKPYLNMGGNSIGGKKSKGGMGGGAFDLVGWAQSSLSSLGGGVGMGQGKGKGNVLANALGLNNFASTVKSAVQPGLTMLRNQAQMTIDGIANISQTGMQTISAGVQTGAMTISGSWGTMEATRVATTQMGGEAIVATNQATAATVQATTAQMMGWLMAVLALFSLFGGGGGESTSESTTAINLGRSPNSYYMTPTPVMQSTTFNVPSFDIGGNIEQDMFAMVHKGEMVLTPEQADVIRNTARNGGSLGGNMGGSNANIKSNISVSTVDSRGFERVLKDYNRQLSKNVKKGIRNGYLNAKGLV